MLKYLTLYGEDSSIEYDGESYEEFIEKIQKELNLNKKIFSIKHLNEDNFLELITEKENFDIVCNESYVRLNGKNKFSQIETTEETRDFLMVYGFYPEDKGDLPIINAIRRKRSDLVEVFLSEYGDELPNVTRPEPLAVAVFSMNIEISRMILEKYVGNSYQHKNIEILEEAEKSCLGRAYEAFRYGEYDYQEDFYIKRSKIISLIKEFSPS